MSDPNTKTELHAGWIGVDLDGTLAHYDEWRGLDHIGPPVRVMLNRVKAWLAAGETVKIFTARACVPEAVEAVEVWCWVHVGQKLEVTNVKDFAMIELWDDRCVQVIKNTGRRMAILDGCDA